MLTFYVVIYSLLNHSCNRHFDCTIKLLEGSIYILLKIISTTIYLKSSKQIIKINFKQENLNKKGDEKEGEKSKKGGKERRW